MTKYNSRKTTVNGIVFASQREAARYIELRSLEAAGYITDLELQPCFELQPKFKRGGKTERAVKYIGDFRYFDVERRCTVTEDCKGHRTDVYRLKKKLLLYKFPDIVFLET